MERVIHHMWLDRGTADNEQPPDKYVPFCESFRAHNPTARFLFWNTARVDHLFRQRPELQRFRAFWAHRLERHIERCDFARYAVMFAHGGIYADCDLQCRRSLDPLFEREQWFVYEPQQHCHPRTEGLAKKAFNGIFGCRAGNPLWLRLMEYIVAHYHPQLNAFSVINTTGPGALSRFLASENLLFHAPIFVPTGWLLPFAWSSGRHPTLSSGCTPLDAQTCFTLTTWTSGSNWQHEPPPPSLVQKQSAMVVARAVGAAAAHVPRAARPRLVTARV